MLTAYSLWCALLTACMLLMYPHNAYNKGDAYRIPCLEWFKNRTQQQNSNSAITGTSSAAAQSSQIGRRSLPLDEDDDALLSRVLSSAHESHRSSISHHHSASLHEPLMDAHTDSSTAADQNHLDEPTAAGGHHAALHHNHVPLISPARSDLSHAATTRMLNSSPESSLLFTASRMSSQPRLDYSNTATPCHLHYDPQSIDSSGIKAHPISKLLKNDAKTTTATAADSTIISDTASNSSSLLLDDSMSNSNSSSQHHKTMPVSDSMDSLHVASIPLSTARRNSPAEAAVFLHVNHDSAVAEDEASSQPQKTLRQELMSVDTILISLFFSLGLLYSNFYLSNISQQLNVMSKGNHSLAETYNGIFTFVQSLLPIPLASFIDYVQRRKGYSGNVSIAVVALCTSFIPLYVDSIHLQLIGFVLYSIGRALIIAVTFSFAATQYRSSHYGLVIALITTVCSVFGFALLVMQHIVKDGQNYNAVNAWCALSFIPFMGFSHYLNKKRV